jgi:hypothetical protein
MYSHAGQILALECVFGGSETLRMHARSFFLPLYLSLSLSLAFSRSRSLSLALSLSLSLSLSVHIALVQLAVERTRADKAQRRAVGKQLDAPVLIEIGS